MNSTFHIQVQILCIKLELLDSAAVQNWAKMVKGLDPDAELAYEEDGLPVVPVKDRKLYL